MKFPLRTIAVTFVLAAAATTADAQVAAQNGNPTQRGFNSSFYYGRMPSTARSDPVNTPSANPNITARSTARFGPQVGTPVTPVPEPSEWAMLLAGLALVGFIVRRNSKRS